MVQALENISPDPTYLEFFGLRKHPFSSVVNTAQLFHTEQYSLLMTHLANATRQADSLVVICGADGSGKTTLLNRHVASLGEDNCYATIDDSCTTELQFYDTVLRNLGFGDISGKPRELRRIAKEYLINRAIAGVPVLLIVDNAHLINPKVLEQIRWLAALKIDDTRVISVILAGNPDLVRIINSPAMSQVVFRSQIRFHIRAYTAEETANYVWHLLKLADADDELRFSSEIHSLIHRYTGGTPGLVNMLCDAVLEEACSQKSRVISEELLRKVADERQLTPHVTPLRGKGRRKSDPDFKLSQAAAEPEQTAVRKEPAAPPDSSAALSDAPPDGGIGEDRAVPVKTVARDPGMTADQPQEDTAGIPILSVKNLMEQISGLSQQIGELKSENRRIGSEIAARDKEIDELRADNQRFQDDVAARDKDLLALKEDLDEQVAESRRLTSVAEDNDSEIEQLNRVLKDQGEALQTAEKAAKQLIADLKKEQRATSQTHTDLARSKAENEQLSAARSELEATVADLKARIDELSADLESANKRADDAADINQAVSDLNAELKDKTDKLNEVRGELDRRDATIGELSQRLDGLQQQHSELLSRETAQTERVSDMENELAAGQAIIERFTKELAASRERADGLDEELAASRQRSANLEQELASSRGRIDSLEQELASGQERIGALEAEITARDEDQSDALEIEALRSDLEDANDRLEEAQSQLDGYLQLIDQLEIQARDLQAVNLQVEGLSADFEGDDSDGAADAEITALKVFKNGELDHVVELAEGPWRIMVGRGDDSEMLLDSEFVSRHHALISCLEDDIYIEDLNSFNGTMVNSKVVTRSALRPGDVVTIGDFEIRPSSN